MSGLPKKLNPDNITEAIVELKYSASVPFEMLLGLFYAKLINGYRYSDRQLSNENSSLSLAQNQSEITLKLGKRGLFYNEKISIQVLPNSFVFNCLEQYIGWIDYKHEIEQVLRLLPSENITSWNRVGIRYISEYPEKNLQDIVKLTYSFGLPNIESQTVKFTSHFLYNDVPVILNLFNKIPFLSNKDENFKFVSVVDIDVIQENLDIQSLDDFLIIIHNNHEREKELYFKIIQTDFLASRNPEY